MKKRHKEYVDQTAFNGGSGGWIAASLGRIGGAELVVIPPEGHHCVIRLEVNEEPPGPPLRIAEQPQSHCILVNPIVCGRRRGE